MQVKKSLIHVNYARNSRNAVLSLHKKSANHFKKIKSNNSELPSVSTSFNNCFDPFTKQENKDEEFYVQNFLSIHIHADLQI